MKSIKRLFHMVDNDKVNFLRFEISRMNIKKFNKLSLSEREMAIGWYDQCIQSLESMKS